MQIWNYISDGFKNAYFWGMLIIGFLVANFCTTQILAISLTIICVGVRTSYAYFFYHQYARYVVFQIHFENIKKRSYDLAY